MIKVINYFLSIYTFTLRLILRLKIIYIHRQDGLFLPVVSHFLFENNYLLKKLRAEH